MFNIFKRLKEQEEEIRSLHNRLTREQNKCNMYGEWYYAYRNAINDLYRQQLVTGEQRDLFFETAKKYQAEWRG